jgi:hypothetical protein
MMSVACGLKARIISVVLRSRLNIISLSMVLDLLQLAAMY